MYSSLILAIFGLFGHILSLIILFRPPFIGMTHCLFCTSLGGVDSAYMILRLYIALVQIVIGESPILMNSFSCKFIISFGFMCVHLDAWVIVGLSVGRLIGIFWPLRATIIITKYRIKIFLAIVFIFFIIFDGEMFIRRDLLVIENKENIVKKCQTVHTYGIQG